jgi:hypothetical protein
MADHLHLAFARSPGFGLFAVKSSSSNTEKPTISRASSAHSKPTRPSTSKTRPSTAILAHSDKENMNMNATDSSPFPKELSEVDELRRHIARLESKCTALAHAASKQEEQTAFMKSDYDEMLNKLRAADDFEKLLQEKIDQLENQLDQKDHEIATLRTEKLFGEAAVSKCHEMDIVLSELKHSNWCLTEEIAKLRKVNESLQVSINQEIVNCSQVESDLRLAIEIGEKEVEENFKLKERLLQLEQNKISKDLVKLTTKNSKEIELIRLLK